LGKKAMLLLLLLLLLWKKNDLHIVIREFLLSLVHGDNFFKRLIS